MLFIFKKLPDFETWFSDFFGGFAPFLSAAVDIILLILIARLLILLIHNAIGAWKKYGVQKRGKNEKQLVTFCSVLRSVVSFVVYFIVTILILYRVGLGESVTSVLATAGIGGLAVGLGAQSIIKDVLAGCAILTEQQIAVGDYVSINGNAGTVEDIELRTIRLRAYKGELYIIPNGSISTVINYSRGNTLACVDIPVSNKFNSDTVLCLLEEAMQAFPLSENVTKKPVVTGISEMSSIIVTYRITAECPSMQHVAAEREIRAVVIRTLADAGIILQEPIASKHA